MRNWNAEKMELTFMSKNIFWLNTDFVAVPRK